MLGGRVGECWGRVGECWGKGKQQLTHLNAMYGWGRRVLGVGWASVGGGVGECWGWGGRVLGG